MDAFCENTNGAKSAGCCSLNKLLLVEVGN